MCACVRVGKTVFYSFTYFVFLSFLQMFPATNQFHGDMYKISESLSVAKFAKVVHVSRSVMFSSGAKKQTLIFASAIPVACKIKQTRANTEHIIFT